VKAIFCDRYPMFSALNLVQYPLDHASGRGGRVVECGRLEICLRVTLRGFESPPLRFKVGLTDVFSFDQLKLTGAK
jgi:hypothetical protein